MGSTPHRHDPGASRCGSSDRRLAAFVALGLVVVAVTVLATAPVAGAAQADANDSAANESSGPTELAPLNVTAAAANDSASVTLSGEGQTVTDPFTLDDGLLLVAYSHSGDSNFQLDLWNETIDEEAAFLANRIGAVEGVGASGLQAGNYSLEITADGPWTVTLFQPNATNATATVNESGTVTDAEPAGNATDAARNATTRFPNATDAPAVASGEGEAVLGPVNFTESVTLTANHSGESNFQVTVWSENATSLFDASYAFNEIGQLEGAETRVRHTGTAWIVVAADGAWTLSIE